MTQGANHAGPLSGIDGKEPPHDAGAEAAVLSAVLVDREALPRVIDFLRADHFFSEANRRTYEAAVDLFRAKRPIDPQTVMSRLRARNRLVQVGGDEFFASLIEARSHSNARVHALAVHDMWRRRQVALSCARICGQAYGDVPDVQAWCDNATRTLGLIGTQNPIRPIESNDETLNRILCETVAPPGAEGEPSVALTGYPTGIHGLDRIVGGLAKGSKTTVAATTGVGKTAIAIQLAVAMAKRGVGVLYFSMEMKREEILRRALAHEAQVSGERIKRRALSPRDKIALADASARLTALPWKIDETPRPTIEEVAAATRAVDEQMMLNEHMHLGMVVLDYIQRIEPSRHMLGRDPHEQVKWATRGFKTLCQELDVIGLELAQAKDGPPGRKPEKPKASSGIADSTQIAKESDDVIFLWPEDDPHDDPRQSVTAIVAKQRGGKKGEVSLMFRRDMYTFIDPNAPGVSNPSRQYVDQSPPDSGNSLTEGM